jgi:hypothetical protein
VGQGRGAGELSAGTAGKTSEAGAALASADTAGLVNSCCSITFSLSLGALCLRLSREPNPAVERSGPFFAAGARLDSHSVGDSFYDIAEPYFLLLNKAGQPNAIRLAFDFLC